LDDFSLVKLNGDPANKTAFADGVVKALKAYRPGVLRYWAGQLGDTIENLTAPVGARRRAGFSAFGTTAGDQQLGLHEFLQLSEAVDAEPWVVIPITISTSDASWLIDYLAGPVSTSGGARRAARGQVQPWTTMFRKIHLEFGNEAWNSIFKGGTMEYGQPYGNRAQDIFAAMRSNPNFQGSGGRENGNQGQSPTNSSPFDLVIGGQAYYPERNGSIQAACNNNDSFATAPYQQMQVDSFGAPDQLWGPAFAEAEMDSVSGNSNKTVHLVNANAAGRTVRQTVYEINFHTTAGKIDQATLDSFTPALGAGIAVADHMLILLQKFGMREQMLFALPQYSFQRGDGKTVKLWGSVVDMGVTDVRRPQFLALQMINRILRGDMLGTKQTGADPVWDQPLTNGVHLSKAHYLHSYAFAQGDSMALVLVNLSLATPLPVTFSGQAPAGAVTLNQLTSANPSDNNESGAVVVPKVSTITNFSASNPFELPPYSLSVLSWTRASASGGQSVH
jgi:hypothetical protein